MSRRGHTGRHGSILILVLVVIVLLSLSGYTFTQLMVAEYRAARLHGQSLQARVLADSGLALAKQIVVEDAQTLDESGGMYNNPLRFCQVVLAEDGPDGLGRFTLIAPGMDDQGLRAGTRYGLEDESVRLNLNILITADELQENGGRTLLMALPGMTEDVADAILDWLDEDDEQREFGAELDYYAGQEPPYAPKNGPLDSVEELLLVRGVTPELLFGADTNRNGVLDPNEPSGEALGGVDNSDGSLNSGWAAYLTLYSAERNLQADYAPRVYLNQDDLEKLYSDLEQMLGAEKATFIVSYRQSGPYTGNTKPQQFAGQQPDLTQAGNTKFTSVLDLVGAQTQLKASGQSKATVLASPYANDPLIMDSYMPELCDKLTVSPAPLIPGRINVNLAPKVVLQGVPGMTEEILSEILSKREVEPSGDYPNRIYESWLLSEGIVDMTQMKALAPFLTGGGHVYRAQSVGYFEEGGPSARLEAVIDATQPTTRIVFWRDLSHLGRGYPLEVLGLQNGE